MTDKKRVFLSRAQVYKLCSLLEMRYVEAGVTDREFAVMAENELGFPLNENHVTHCRIDLGIPSYRQKLAKTPKPGTIVQRLEALERGMDKLWERLS